MVMGWYIVLDDSSDEECFLEIARRIDKSKLKKLAVFLGAPLKCECGTTLDDMVATYDQIPTVDLSCYMSDLGEQRALCQLASGGGDCRRMKNALRTAMICLFLNDRVLNKYEGKGTGVKTQSGFHIEWS